MVGHEVIFLPRREEIPNGPSSTLARYILKVLAKTHKQPPCSIQAVALATMAFGGTTMIRATTSPASKKSLMCILRMPCFCCQNHRH
jgi:hypothetical protein